MYLLELHAFLFSAVHRDKDIAFLLEAIDRSLGEMRQMELFTS
ncbi:hypothetical protein [Streptomyces tubercidicus]